MRIIIYAIFNIPVDLKPAEVLKIVDIAALRLGVEVSEQHISKMV